MDMIKEGLYCICNAKEYAFRTLDGNMLRLISEDKSDLESGFTVCRDDHYGFECIKDIDKKCIDKAYRYDPYVIYKDIKCHIRSFNIDKNEYYLETCATINPDNPSKSEFIEELIGLGFVFADYEKYGGYYYRKYVSPEDPYLRVIEQRKEIDINTL